MQNLHSDHAECKDRIEGCLSDLWRYCYSLTNDRDRSGDLTQYAALQALENLASGFGRACELGGKYPLFWMMKTARNHHINRQKSYRVRNRTDLDEFEFENIKSDSDRVEARVSAREQLGQIMEIPDEIREPGILVSGFGLTMEETANILGIPTTTVGSRIVRFRKHIAQIKRKGLA